MFVQQIVLILAVATPALASTIRGRDLTNGELESLSFVTIKWVNGRAQPVEEDFLGDDTYDYSIPAGLGEHDGFTVKATTTGDIDFVKFTFDGRETRHYDPPTFYMDGNTKDFTWINEVHYLKETCGPKEVTVEGHIWEGLVFTKTIKLNAICPGEEDKCAEDKLKSIFEHDWFDEQDDATQKSYMELVCSLYTFLEPPKADAHTDDFYFGFAPLLLRASFHSSGTYDLLTGTGGSNGGTIFNPAELEDEQNGCIDKGTKQLQALFDGHAVPLSDAVVIAGAVSLDVMKFPRMDLVRIQGGRDMVENVAIRDRLPSADDDPMTLFAEQYGLTLEELVGLVGGGHNFGSAHGKCSGYIGQWTETPLSWFGSDNSVPTFFPDLLREDWRWYEVCTYENNSVIYTSIEDPFASGTPEEEEEHGDGDSMACPIMQSRVPLICEEQAMRGCDFADGTYDLAESPCDINLLQMRLKSDFFLKANPKLLPHTEEFANNPDKLAEVFGIAYHKLTHLGLDRCGLSGHGCSEGTVCSTSGNEFASKTCVAK